MLNQSVINFASNASFKSTTFTLGYQNQWVGLKGAPKVANFISSIPLSSNSTIGILYENDRIGVHNRNTGKLAYTYSFFASKDSKLAFSLAARVDQGTSDFGSLDKFDPNELTTPRYNYIKPNFDFGAYYFKSNFYLGFSAQNLFDNKLQLNNSVTSAFDVARVQFKLHSGASFKVGDNKLLVSGLAKTFVGSALTADINAAFEFKETFGIGVSWRTTKDIIPIAYFKLKQFMLSYAFSYTYSDLRNVSSGSHEVFFRYEIKPKKQILTILCPRF